MSNCLKFQIIPCNVKQLHMPTMIQNNLNKIKLLQNSVSRGEGPKRPRVTHI